MVDAVVCEACKQVRHQESHIVTFYCTCVSVGHHKGLIKETTREFNTERIPSYSSYQPPTDSVLICLNFPWIPNITSFTSWKRGGRCESKNLLLWKTTEEDGRSDSTVGAPWGIKWTANNWNITIQTCSVSMCMRIHIISYKMRIVCMCPSKQQINIMPAYLYRDIIRRHDSNHHSYS